MTPTEDVRAVVLRALLRDEHTPEEIAKSSGKPLKQVRLAVAAGCGSGWLAQTGLRGHDRLVRLTDAGREWLAGSGR